MECEMCGAQGKLILARVEGSEIHVCSNCSKYGQVLESKNTFRKKSFQKEEGPQEIIVFDYAKRIKKAREELGITQDDFAKRVQEKVSVLSHIESGKSEPSIALAKKLEKTFHITLVEFERTVGEIPKSESGSGMTIGDFIKVRKANK